MLCNVWWNTGVPVFLCGFETGIFIQSNWHPIQYVTSSIDNT